MYRRESLPFGCSVTPSGLRSSMSGTPENVWLALAWPLKTVMVVWGRDASFSGVNSADCAPVVILRTLAGPAGLSPWCMGAISCVEFSLGWAGGFWDWGQALMEKVANAAKIVIF